jgi:chaperone required for assembly of F1-ATPase
MRRFWREVGVAADGDGWAVRLDTRPLRTPARRALIVPTRALADAIAAEWRDVGDQVDAARMPLTRLATTVVDLMPARRADAEAEALGFAATDLLCYRAAGPAELVLRQARAWQPWLEWAARVHGARLVATEGVMAVAQDAAALARLRAVVEGLDAWRLVGLHAAVTLTGSLVLGLAVEAGALDAEAAFALAQLDELFEIEQWGEEEQQRIRHAALRRDLAAAARYAQALRG